MDRPRVHAWKAFLVAVAAALPAAVCASTPAPAEAAPAWLGNFEGGSLAQWSHHQVVPGRARVVKRPRRDGRFAARFEVRPGDDPINANGERTELISTANEIRGKAGRENWYGWSTYFPRELNPTPGERATNIFTQWHESIRGSCVPPVTFALNKSSAGAPSLRLRLRGGREKAFCQYQTMHNWDFGQIEYDRWYDFVVHVRWSARPSRGFISVWINGVNVVPRMKAATLYPGSNVYLKQGYYRTESDATSVIYHDAMRRGRSYRSVAPRRR